MRPGFESRFTQLHFLYCCTTTTCIYFLFFFSSSSIYPNIVPALHQVQLNHTNTVCPVVPKPQNCMSSEETPYKHTWQLFLLMILPRGSKNIILDSFYLIALRPSPNAPDTGYGSNYRHDSRATWTLHPRSHCTLAKLKGRFGASLLKPG